MTEILKLIPAVIYILVGLISLAMAFKILSSDKYLPFHEEAAGKPWCEIDDALKPVIMALMRLAGMGFLVISVLLIAGAIVNYIKPDRFYKYFIPAVSLIFCTGLFIINYRLYKITKAGTPWKESLFAMAIIAAGIVIAIFS